MLKLSLASILEWSVKLILNENETSFNENKKGVACQTGPYNGPWHALTKGLVAPVAYFVL